ncbi:MAG: hypothetical protein K1Y02_18920 [Candidatus Hydrogenedentes bacterium]|nr:hypothetical protein [Candidatus Hydrogenedentota bacterium]
MITEFDASKLDQAFALLEGRLRLRQASPVGLVVCGGASLLATGLIARTTRDVDIIALMSEDGTLLDPDPLPAPLLAAADEVREILGLPEEWLNNRPSRSDGGLFRMGLPTGLDKRLKVKRLGPNLSVGFIDRLDQIHLKLYASVDRGGYHIADLIALHPSDDELEASARWSMTHDVSQGFRETLKRLLDEIGHAKAAEAL